MYLFFLTYHSILLPGDKMTDEEVDQVIQGQEDPQGNINYEGMYRVYLMNS